MKKTTKSPKQLPPETYNKSTVEQAVKAKPTGPVVLPVGKANVPFSQ